MKLDPCVVVIMGVSGSGKTTVGKTLAKCLGWPLEEGDEYHSKENIRKMRRGVPLEDNDRWPWLKRLKKMIEKRLAHNKRAVLACSALKESYRKYLLIGPRVKLVYIKASLSLVKERMQRRSNHFMKEKMAESQFADLEEPQDALHIDVRIPPKENVTRIIESFGLHPPVSKPG